MKNVGKSLVLYKASCITGRNVDGYSGQLYDNIGIGLFYDPVYTSLWLSSPKFISQKSIRDIQEDARHSIVCRGRKLKKSGCSL